MDEGLRCGASLTPRLPSRTKQVESLRKQTEPRAGRQGDRGAEPPDRRPVREEDNVEVAGEEGSYRTLRGCFSPPGP